MVRIAVECKREDGGRRDRNRKRGIDGVIEKKER
jgi:hypothetical protein